MWINISVIHVSWHYPAISPRNLIKGNFPVQVFMSWWKLAIVQWGPRPIQCTLWSVAAQQLGYFGWVMCTEYCYVYRLCRTYQFQTHNPVCMLSTVSQCSFFTSRHTQKRVHYNKHTANIFVNILAVETSQLKGLWAEKKWIVPIQKPLCKCPESDPKFYTPIAVIRKTFSLSVEQSATTQVTAGSVTSSDVQMFSFVSKS